MNLRACMGGWCAKRDKCAHYHAYDRRSPLERMCQTNGDESWIPFIQGLPQPPAAFVPIQLASPQLAITEIAP